MGVAIHSRLGEVLESKDMTVTELGHEIKDRFGLSVNLKTLYELALTEESIQRVNIEVVVAAAAVLGVSLDDLFTVRTTPNGVSREASGQILSAKESRWLAELLDRQGRARLSEAERTELDSLISTYGERLHEQSVQEIAHKRGMSVEQVRREAEAAVTEARDWLHAFEADPRRRQEVAELVKRANSQSQPRRA